jgi:hypothetical protein
VWPPCLANDAGPVEFAVNVAPKEWLTGVLGSCTVVLCRTSGRAYRKHQRSAARAIGSLTLADTRRITLLRAGKRFQRRVPCWPVSGLSLHITFGEQLLEMVDLDICGTTKVR